MELVFFLQGRTSDIRTLNAFSMCTDIEKYLLLDFFTACLMLCCICLTKWNWKQNKKSYRDYLIWEILKLCFTIQTTHVKKNHISTVPVQNRLRINLRKHWNISSAEFTELRKAVSKQPRLCNTVKKSRGHAVNQQKWNEPWKWTLAFLGLDLQRKFRSAKV